MPDAVSVQSLVHVSFFLLRCLKCAQVPLHHGAERLKDIYVQWTLYGGIFLPCSKRAWLMCATLHVTIMRSCQVSRLAVLQLLPHLYDNFMIALKVCILFGTCCQLMQICCVCQICLMCTGRHRHSNWPAPHKAACLDLCFGHSEWPTHC